MCANLHGYLLKGAHMKIIIVGTCLEGVRYPLLSDFKYYIVN